jgi:hypothetical protein
MATPAGAPHPSGRSVLAAIPLPMVASVVLSTGVVLLFLANLLIAIGEPTGTPGNVRILQFLSPADVAVGAILVLAVALVALFSPHEPPEPHEHPESASTGSKLLGPADVRMIAGVVAATVAAAALVRAIISLTVAHQGVAIKFGNLVDGLAAVLVALVAALWAATPKGDR